MPARIGTAVTRKPRVPKVVGGAGRGCPQGGTTLLRGHGGWSVLGRRGNLLKRRRKLKVSCTLDSFCRYYAHPHLLSLHDDSFLWCYSAYSYYGVARRLVGDGDIALGTFLGRAERTKVAENCCGTRWMLVQLQRDFAVRRIEEIHPAPSKVVSQLSPRCRVGVFPLKLAAGGVLRGGGRVCVHAKDLGVSRTS